MSDTQCECEFPGWCRRHGIIKSPHLYELCKTRPDYFAAWESGSGPTQTKGGQGGPVDRATKELVDERLAVCKLCDQYRNHRCKLMSLGCRMSFTKKISSVSAKCPLEKWDDNLA